MRRLITLKAFLFEKGVTFRLNLTQDNFHIKYLKGNSLIGKLGESFEKFDYYVSYNSLKVEWLQLTAIKEEDKKNREVAKKIIHSIKEMINFSIVI